ncbi:MAG: C10 family peptidase [Prevotella sp.]|nr:C10 family peptidase [Prevotella sp.]
MRFFVALILIIISSVRVEAAPRTLWQKQQAAITALQNNSDAKLMRVGGMPKLLKQTAGLSILGYEEGGFAIVPNDDMYPEIMGVSYTKYNPNTLNTNFKWWLEATEAFVSQSRSEPLQTTKPDTSKYPASVEPLMTSQWGQEEPYSNLVPHRYPTGCVATAAAQVLRYNRWPQYGQGTVYTYYPFGDFDGIRYEADIDGVEYLYSLMPDYFTAKHTSAQKTAVAKLMYHIGLAMKAQYSYDGTGSYSSSLAYGLRRNLGYPLAVTLDKDDYTESEWMELIYGNISKGYPIIYGGSDSDYTGHEFVLHGYDSSGKVYINWGWDGEEDGYFNLSSLTVMWGFYNFNYYQDMVLRVNTDQLYVDLLEIEVEEPGTLREVIGNELCDSVIGLHVRGKINSTDLKTLRAMAGSDSVGHGTKGNLSFLDLSEAEIIAGGNAYLVENGDSLFTVNDELPYKAFSNCKKLIDVTLPNRLKHYGDGVFAQCINLDTVRVNICDESDFMVNGSFVMSADSTELIEFLPTEEIDVVIPYGTKVIHDYALAGRFHYERLTIPETVEYIGKYAFNRCFDLARTYIYATEAPTIDQTAIDKLDLSLRYLYVPNGSRNKYLSAAGWKLYGSSGIKEFDPTTTDIGNYIPTLSKCGSQYVYDINGKIVINEGVIPSRKGIYIIDGKKVIK